MGDLTRLHRKGGIRFLGMRTLTVLTILMLCACSLQRADDPDSILAMQVHTPRPVEGEWRESDSIVVAIDGSSATYDIASTGFGLWISQYAAADAPIDYAITDYRIDSITESDDPFFAEDYDVAFEVEYSVRPANIQSARWVAGDGRLTDDGWVLGKVHFLGIVINGNSASMYVLGPCPMC